MVNIPLNFNDFALCEPIPQISSIFSLPIVSNILSGRITKIPPVFLALSLASLAKVFDEDSPIDTGIDVLSKMVWRIFLLYRYKWNYILCLVRLSLYKPHQQKLLQHRG